MKVGIDITPAIYDRGVSRYTTNLVRALLTQSRLHLSLYGSTFRQKHKLEGVVADFRRAFPYARFDTAIQSYPPVLQEYLWGVFHQNPVRKSLPDIDVFHSWDWLQPPDLDLPLVSTIHDLAILRFPETAHPKILQQHRKAWKVLKERRAHIIAVSKSTKTDILQLLDFPSENVHLVYEALPYESMRTSEEMTEEVYEQLRVELQLNRPYILFVGTREPRKNLFTLIEAWQPLQNQVDLLIAGEEGWDATTKQASQYMTPHLRFLGKVSAEALSVLYGEAAAFVFPSLYEGFGLPILEAFYHGTPVVTSCVSSLPEVAGNAAELVEPRSAESIRRGIENILNENREAQQRRLQKMILRLQLFSWSTVADQTTQVYQHAVESWQ